MARFKRRPVAAAVTFEANQYVKAGELVLGMRSREDGTVYVRTIQGRDVDVSPGEFVIQEQDGEHYYPCSADIFWERYEPA